MFVLKQIGQCPAAEAIAGTRWIEHGGWNSRDQGRRIPLNDAGPPRAQGDIEHFARLGASGIEAAKDGLDLALIHEKDVALFHHGTHSLRILGH